MRSEEDLMREVGEIVGAEMARMTRALTHPENLFTKTQARMDLSPNISVQTVSVAADVLMKYMAEGWWGGLGRMAELFVSDNSLDGEDVIGTHVCELIDHHVQQVVGGLCWIAIQMLREGQAAGVDLSPFLSALVTYKRDEVTLNAGGWVGSWLPTHPLDPDDDDGTIGVPVSP